MLSISTGIKALKDAVQGTVLAPGDPGFDDERAAWNRLVEHHPAVVVVPTGAGDIATAVRFAAAEGLPVAVQATGHGAVVPADGAVLISTRHLDSIEIDPNTATARIAAGATWRPVIEKAAPYGLAPLVGSSSTVGAVGYLTGGGLPVLGRQFGFSADDVRGFEIVTADGSIRQVSAQDEPDLFWAVRGGKGNFGVVTSVEFGLLPLSRLYGGRLTFPQAKARDVFAAWVEWTAKQPDEMASSVAFLRIPDLPMVPEPVRGQRSFSLRIAYTGEAAEGERMIQVFRDFGPELDTVTEMPYRNLGEIHGDPDQPTPVLDNGALLRPLDGAAVDRIVSLVGPDADVPQGLVEIRHLGGALSRTPQPPNAVGNRSGAFGLLAAFVVLPGELARVGQALQAVMVGIQPWDSGTKLTGYLGGTNILPDQVRAAYRDEDWARLTAIKAAYDPANTFRLTHNIPPAPPVAG